MTWFGWFYVVFAALGAAVQILTIGRPRQPLKPIDVLVAMTLSAAFIYGFATVGFSK